MKQVYRDLRSTILVALIAFTVCWASNHWIFYPKYHPTDPDQWLKDKLGITKAQLEGIKDVEERYTQDRARIMSEITEVNKKLAKALIEEKQYSDRVKSLVMHTDKLHAELKEVTLRHFYDMRPALTPEQIEKMNQLTVHALSHNP